MKDLERAVRQCVEDVQEDGWFTLLNLTPEMLIDQYAMDPESDCFENRFYFSIEGRAELENILSDTDLVEDWQWNGMGSVDIAIKLMEAEEE